MSHRNMKEELTCPICMELFRQPRRLPCGHSYCYVCLKAMLDRCTEYSGLYLDYSRSLVCPECREEVNIETDRGVDMIPPDFKLSKLVDLFKFMKTNDSSDSSCDELQSTKPVPSADSASTPATAAVEVISLPATSPSTGPSSVPASHLFTPTATGDRPTRPLHVSPPSTTADASGPAVSTDSQLRSRNTHRNVESSRGEAALATVSSPAISTQPDAECSSSQTTGDATSPRAGPVATHSGQIGGSNTGPVATHSGQISGSNTGPVATHSGQISGSNTGPVATYSGQIGGSNTGPVATYSGQISGSNTGPVATYSGQIGGSNTGPVATYSGQIGGSNTGPVATYSGQIGGCNTGHVDRNSCLNYLPPVTVSYNAVTTLPSSSQSPASAVGNHLHVAGVSVSSGRAQPVSCDSLTSNGRNPSEGFSSVSEQGTDGGVAALGDHANGLSVRPEQHVDSLEILSNWVNENHCYSQGSRNLSHSAVSLPVEVVLEEAESCHENSSELTCNVARGTRAQSVPTETREWNRSAQPGGSGEHVASKSLHNVKARKVKRGVFSRFVDSDTSSDSSSNSGRERQRSAGKPKRWLMTRFLRSVILSDSSSTDYSDDDDGVDRNATSPKRERTTLHSVQNNSRPAGQRSHPQTGAAAAGSSQEVDHQRIPESSQSTGSNTDHNITRACKLTAGLQSQTAPQQHNLSASERDRNTASKIAETVPRSIDSSTLAKEPVPEREDALSCAGTLPKATQGWRSAGEGQHIAHLPFPATASYDQDCQLSECRSPSFDPAAHFPQRVSSSSRRHAEQTSRTHLPGAGSPPTFYDNLNALSDGDEGRTFYDNVGIERDSRGAEGSQPGLVRDLRLNPCHQQQSLEWTSEHGPGSTLYDNIDSHHIITGQTSNKANHVHSRNPITDIDDLKTGYEHYHMENMNNIEADPDREPDAGRGQEASDIQHMGELDNSSRGLFQSSPAAQQASENLPEPGCVSSSHGWKHPASTGHVPVHSGDHHSFYDNMNHSHSLGGPQGAAGVAQRAHRTEGGTLSGDRNARFAHGEGNRGAGHPKVFNTQGRNVDDELQCVDNYLDHYSEHFRNAASSKNTASAKSVAFAKNAPATKNGASSGMTVGRMKSQESGVGVTATGLAETASSSTVGCGSQSTGATSESRNAESRNVEQDDVGAEVIDGENGSNSGTPIQDKKKPRSRLKKFLTSLLSLSSSSSSDDDELHHKETSSDSSDW